MWLLWAVKSHHGVVYGIHTGSCRLVVHEAASRHQTRSEFRMRTSPASDQPELSGSSGRARGTATNIKIS